MGNIRNFVSRFSGIIRLVVFIVLVGLIIFFGVRFIQNRQASERAEQTVKTAQTNDQADNSEQTPKKQSESSKTSDASKNDDPEPQVPKGIADSNDAKNSTTQNIPATGVGSSSFIIAAVLTTVTYIVVSYKSDNHTVK